MMPNSLNFRRELRVVLLEQAFLEVPIKFRICGNPESRQGIVLGLGVVKSSCKMGTLDAPELLAVSGS